VGEVLRGWARPWRRLCVLNHTAPAEPTMLLRSAGCQTDGLGGCPGTERTHMQRICSTTPVSSQAHAADLVADLPVYGNTQKRAAVQHATRYQISNSGYRMASRQYRPGDIPFGKALPCYSDRAPGHATRKHTLDDSAAYSRPQATMWGRLDRQLPWPAGVEIRMCRMCRSKMLWQPIATLASSVESLARSCLLLPEPSITTFAGIDDACRMLSSSPSSALSHMSRHWWSTAMLNRDAAGPSE
jgi:hypothetical protein